MSGNGLLGALGELEARLDEVAHHERELKKVPPPKGLTEFFGLEPAEKEQRRNELLAKESDLAKRTTAARVGLESELKALGCAPDVLEHVLTHVSIQMRDHNNDQANLEESKGLLRDFVLKVEASHRAPYDAWVHEKAIKIAAEEASQRIGLKVGAKIV